jgi:hypothetical protein
MKTIRKATRSKKRAINKAIDRRFSLRNQRAPMDGANAGKSLMDIPDVPRRRRAPAGPRRTQLGRSLRQGELAERDPVRED